MAPHAHQRRRTRACVEWASLAQRTTRALRSTSLRPTGCRLRRHARVCATTKQHSKIVLPNMQATLLSLLTEATRHTCDEQVSFTVLRRSYTDPHHRLWFYFTALTCQVALPGADITCIGEQAVGKQCIGACTQPNTTGTTPYMCVDDYSSKAVAQWRPFGNSTCKGMCPEPVLTSSAHMRLG